MLRRRTKWELYADMVARTAQAQALTAQELDIRNFFQRSNVLFCFHPVWKAIEDQCFYVYDFDFRFTSSAEPAAHSSMPPLNLRASPGAGLWVLECSYTTLKPGPAKQFLRKRCPYFDRKFRAAKRRGVNSVLLLEALHVPPQVLSQSMPTLEHVDVLFTSVDAFKGWVLKNLERKEVRQEPAACELPEPRKRSQAQLTGFLRARGTQPRSEAAPVSEENNEKGVT